MQSGPLLHAATNCKILSQYTLHALKYLSRPLPVLLFGISQTLYLIFKLLVSVLFLFLLISPFLAVSVQLSDLLPLKEYVVVISLTQTTTAKP